MRKIVAAASCAAILFAIPAQAGVQDVPQAAPAASADAGQATLECKPKKKKKKGGLGLGGVLRAARNSGLIGGIAGRVGGDAYLAHSAASTAIDVAASQPASPSQDSSGEGSGC
ncbi:MULTISPECIES: hypothetical protein [unclassified Sphingomonas]|uniref:hypothetical protein n=1 Tax=Sphingomonas TaxID=13687 RepID=UPI001ACF1206|nr:MULTISPECIES: hypothetical protein [unclassified Sphingomonas]MBN8813577.1 hypothetical protein [Sphingomonas sp.]